MEASEEDKLPDSEVVGQVVSHLGTSMYIFLTPFLTDVVCIFFLPQRKSEFI